MAESIPIKVDTGQATAAIDDLANSAAAAADDFSGLTAMLNEFLKRRSAELGKPVNLFGQDDLETLKAIRAEFQLLVRDTKGGGIGKQLSTQPGGASAVRSPEQINGGLVESDAKKLQATLDKVLMTVLRRVSATTGTSATGLTANELGAARGTGPHPPPDPADPSTPPGGQAPPRTPKHPDTPLSKSAKVLGYAAQQLSPLAGGAVNQAASMGAEGMAGRGMGGMIAGGGVAGLAAGAGIGLLAAGLYKAASAVNAGIDREKVLATDIDKFRRSLGGTADSFSELRDQSRMVGEQFNLNYETSRKITTDFANVAKTNKGAVDQASEGVGLAQAVGVDEAQGAGFMASLRKDQSIGDKKSDARMMGVTFAEALKRTGSTLNASELMSAMQGFSSDTAHRSLTTGNVEGYAGMLSAMVGSKTPGLDIGNSRNLMARADSSFQGGGGAGQASSTLQFMALGGDRLGLMGVKMREAAGMMATNDQVFGNPDNPVNKYTGGQMLQNKGSSTGLEDLIKLIKENSGGNKELEINTLANHLKLNPNEAATFLNMQKEGKLGETLAMARQYKGVDLNKMSGNGYSMLADVAFARGDDSKLASVRDGLQKRSDLTEDQQSQLTQMHGLSGDKLQDALVKFSTSLEREKTEGQKIAADAAKTANATDRMAALLVPTAIKANEYLAALVEKMAPNSEVAKKIAAEKQDERLRVTSEKFESGELGQKTAANRNETYKQNDTMLRENGASRKDRVENATEHIQQLGDKAVPYQKHDGKNPEREKEDASIWSEAQAAVKKKNTESLIRQGVDPAAQAPKAPKAPGSTPSQPVVLGEVRRKTAAELAAEAVPAPPSATPPSATPPAPVSSQGAGSSPTKTGKDGVVTPEMRAKMLESDAALAKVNPNWRPGMTEAQIKQESGFRSDAVSSAGAEGYTQIMPRTRRLFEKREGRTFKAGDFDDDLALHRLHMTDDLKREKNVPSALRAYNGGPNFRRSDSTENANYAGGVYSKYDNLPPEARIVPVLKESPERKSPPAPTDSSRAAFAAIDPRRTDKATEVGPEAARTIPVPKENPEVQTPRFKPTPVPAPTESSRGIFAATDPRRSDVTPQAEPVQLAKAEPVQKDSPGAAKPITPELIDKSTGLRTKAGEDASNARIAAMQAMTDKYKKENPEQYKKERDASRDRKPAWMTDTAWAQTQAEDSEIDAKDAAAAKSKPIPITKPVPIPAGNPQSAEQAKAEQQRVNVAFSNQKHSIDVNVHSGSGTDRQEQSHQVAWVSKPKASGTLALA